MNLKKVGSGEVPRGSKISTQGYIIKCFRSLPSGEKALTSIQPQITSLHLAVSNTEPLKMAKQRKVILNSVESSPFRRNDELY